MVKAFAEINSQYMFGTAVVSGSYLLFWIAPVP
jgi:hypothetical protein